MIKKYILDTGSYIIWQMVAQLLRRYFFDAFTYQEREPGIFGKPGVFDAICDTGWKFRFKIDFHTGEMTMIHIKSPDEVIFDFDNFSAKNINEDKWETRGEITDLVELCKNAVMLNASYGNDVVIAMQKYLHKEKDQTDRGGNSEHK